MFSELPGWVQRLVQVSELIILVTLCIGIGFAVHLYKKRFEPTQISALRGFAIGATSALGYIWLVRPLLGLPMRNSIFSTVDSSPRSLFIWGAITVVLLSGVWFWLYLEVVKYQATISVQVAQQNRTAASVNFLNSLTMPQPLWVPAMQAFNQFYDKFIGIRQIDPSTYARKVSKLAHYLPPHALLAHDESADAKPWGHYILEWSEANPRETNTGIDDMDAVGDLWDGINKIGIKLAIPESMRNEHHQIVANPGHGKTTCLTNMILDDLSGDAALVVIDSQGDMIKKLAPHIPIERLILIDPETCPPALNIFAGRVEGEKGIADALELFSYIFSSVGQPLTGKQSMVYRALSRLCMEIPGASIHTMRELLTESGTTNYQSVIATLGPTSRSFFEQYDAVKNNQYRDTRAEILVRMDTILLEGTFSDMVGATSMRLNIPAALEEGKVILINTNSSLLKDASSVFGRIFIAQILQHVRSRPEGNRKRVYLYCDEFADYADDSKMLSDCFSQGRKYELAMVICFQLLAPLPEKFRAFISSCTAIKFAGGVSALDSRTLAAQMRTTPELIDAQPKGSFLASFKGIGVLPWKVDFDRLDRLPRPPEHALQAIEALMREQYGVEPKPPGSPAEEIKDSW